MTDTVLIFIDWFYPGYKAGGPIKSVTNIALALASKKKIFIYTSDRDLNETISYNTVQTNQWVNFGLNEDVKVYYASPDQTNFSKIKSIIKDIKPSYIYLNHLYSPKFVLMPLLAWRLFFYTQAKLVLAPRGALFQSALHYKNTFLKKIALIKTMRLLRLQKNICFHATTTAEAKTVRDYFGNATIQIANNLPNIAQASLSIIDKQIGHLKIIFVARIVEIKNLHLLLIALMTNTYKIELTIVGPKEDELYFAKCKTICSQLPSNVQVHFLGAVDSSSIEQLTQQHHLFCLPTQGENFGHSIFESFLIGRPCLISNNTPWKNLQQTKAGWDVDINASAELTNCINIAANWNNTGFEMYCQGAWQVANKYINNDNLVQPYLQLFP